MDPKLKNKFIPNYFFLQSWHEMVEKFAKVFNMKIAPMLLLMTQKHQTSQARYLPFTVYNMAIWVAKFPREG